MQGSLPDINDLDEINNFITRNFYFFNDIRKYLSLAGGPKGGYQHLYGKYPNKHRSDHKFAENVTLIGTCEYQIDQEESTCNVT